jgi:hypothetical protein
MPNQDSRSTTDMNKTESMLIIERLTIDKKHISEDIPIFSDEKTNSQPTDGSRRGGTVEIDLVEDNIDDLNKKSHLLTYLRRKR